MEVRTSDNVKIRIQGTLFWQVKASHVNVRCATIEIIRRVCVNQSKMTFFSRLLISFHLPAPSNSEEFNVKSGVDVEFSKVADYLAQTPETLETLETLRNLR